MVRGFWGDVINSPLIPFGTEVADEEHKMRFFKHINYQAVYFCTDVSEYNVQRIIHRLQNLEEFEFSFERLKHILGDSYNKPDPKAKKDPGYETKDEKEQEPDI